MDDYLGLQITINDGFTVFSERLNEVIANSDPHWIRREDWAENAMNADTNPEARWICLESPNIVVGAEELHCNLSLHYEGTMISMANITPLEGDNLTVEEYNCVLNVFCDQLLSILATDVRHTIIAIC